MTSKDVVRSRRWQLLIALFVTCIVLAGCPVVPDPDPDPDPDPVIVNPISTSPGLNVTIDSVEIPGNRRPIVHFTVTDDAGQLIPMRELSDVRFLIAYLEPEPPEGSTARYVSYISRTRNDQLQATYDAARLDGLTQEDDGTLSYMFESELPEGYVESATHQLGGQVRRLFPGDGLTYLANPIYGFRPDGGTEVGSREIVNTESCNVCHTRLSAHGSRREVQLCILCHNEGSSDDEGVSVDFAQMIHKIHSGANLPSVVAGEPYEVAGTDYSEVHFPQAVQNCAVCHGDAAMGSISQTMPTLQGCGACHDRTWFGDPAATPEGWENHLAGQQVDNSLCAMCHKPTAPAPAPIFEAHRLVTENPAAPGLALMVNEVTTAATETGVAVTINFSAVDGDGMAYGALSELTTVAATLAYPTTDYENAVRETINAGNSTANDDGTFSYTFNTELPADFAETAAVAMDGRLSFPLGDANVTQGTSSNGRMIFTVDNSEPVERRQIVDNDKCNACHYDLRLHGSLRVGVEYCVMCHNPSGTDISRRPAEAGDPETINFKDMVHQIHRGADLETDYTVYGFGSTPFDFTEIHFPGDLRACEICHVEGSYELPLAMENLSTLVTDGEDNVLSEKLPQRAACTSCHDSLITEVHAILATEPDTRVESCAVCHGNEADFSVLDVHNMGP